MAISPSYPGVYIQETAAIPHSVTPATTNLTAVIGTYPQGPVDTAVLVESPAQFASLFGSLGTASSLAAYAVSQFFLNGGIGAWIVRLDNDTSNAAAGQLALVSPSSGGVAWFTITAASPGLWGDGITVGFRQSGPSSNPDPSHVDFLVYPGALSSPIAPPKGAPLETIPQIAIVQNGEPVDPAHIAKVITHQSSYVTVEAAAPASPPLSPPAPVHTSPPTPEQTFAGLSGGRDASWDASGTDLANALTNDVLVDGGPLDQIAPQLFNIMCIPELAACPLGVQSGPFAAAHEFCENRQAFLIFDPPPPSEAGTNADTTVDTIGTTPSQLSALLTTWGAEFLSSEYIAAATYYPWLTISDPTTGLPRYVPPSATVAGLYASTDTARGVWKAPAGTEAVLAGITGLADTTITDQVNGELNVSGINCLRSFPLFGTLVWGSRTLAGSDIGDSPWKYVPVRRLSDFIEQSLQQSLRWAVFEPNAAALWSSISLEVTAFMSGLFANGAFFGATAAQAYTVACDATTTSPSDMLAGIVNVNVGFVPVDPAEFVMLNIQIQAASAAS